MVNFFIYAKDFSGSTEGTDYYHENGLKTLEEFKRNVEEIKNQNAENESTDSRIIYLHWGDRCYEVDEDATRIAYKELASGNMGTEPGCIIEWIQGNYDMCSTKNKIKLLYIITDGLIDSWAAQRCASLNQDMKYDSVVFYAINESVRNIDLSVAASFFKNNCKTYCNNELYDNVNIGAAYEYSKVNVSNFKDEIGHLKSYIRLKFINSRQNDSTALNEIDNLKSLRNRLLTELSIKSQSTNLETLDKNEFLNNFVQTEWYMSLKSAVNDEKVFIEKSLSSLINYITTENKSYSFDALKMHWEFQPVDEELIVDIDFPLEEAIEFPDVILDDQTGIPVILLTECMLLMKLIFPNNVVDPNAVTPARFSKFKSTMDCPLFLLNDTDLSESIGYFYTLNVYKSLLTLDGKNDPRTRRPFHGGLVLLADRDEFDKYNDYVIAATYFDFRKVHCNMGLFYYLLYKICNNKQWMDRNVVEQLKKYVLRRICNTRCRIGLSSLPLDAKVTTSLRTALWYCVELSSCLFKDDPQHFHHERLRRYHGIAYCMIEILQHFNYNLNLDSIKKRRDLIKHVMALKKIPKHEEKVYYLLEKIFKKDKGFLVSVIKNPKNIYMLNYLKMDHKGMFPDEVLQEKVHLNDFVHLLHYEGDLNNPNSSGDNFRICEKTLRPYFVIDQSKSFYKELFKTAKKVVINNDDDKDNINITYENITSLEFSKILSVYNLFINYVRETGKYPTLTEYIEYILKKKTFNGGLVTIFPTNVYSRAVDVHTRYQNITAKVDVDAFVKGCKIYYNRVQRIKAEEVFKYNDDSDIQKFISDEEYTVSMKKRKIE